MYNTDWDIKCPALNEARKFTILQCVRCVHDSCVNIQEYEHIQIILEDPAVLPQSQPFWKAVEQPYSTAKAIWK